MSDTQVKKTINAKIVLDSVNERNERITTFELTFPRFILPELNTHRIFSRNSASSRAIPYKKMVEMVENDPFIPIAWQKNHSGMQGTEYITIPETVKFLKDAWIDASHLALNQADCLDTVGCTKQITNRLLEPFLWHTVLVTSTNYNEFFELRCPKYGIFSENMPMEFNSRTDLNSYAIAVGDEPYDLSIEDWLSISKSGAEIHIQMLAESMWDELNKSEPQKLKAGEWHIPFGDKFDKKELEEIACPLPFDYNEGRILQAKLAISTARCARLSYMTFDNEINYQKDVDLHNVLLKSKHLSPFEHCCRSMTDKEHSDWRKGPVDFPNFGWAANSKGYIQYRTILEYKDIHNKHI